jgi:hypothetical protein
MRLAILAGCLALAACQTPALIPPTATVAVAEAGTTLDDLYNKAAQIYLATYTVLPAAQKAIVKADFAKAYAAVQLADSAQTLGNSTTLTADISAAEGLIAQAKTDLGAK